MKVIGHAFWERTFSLRHREVFTLAGKLGIAVGLDRDPEKREATRPQEYGPEAQKRARAIGKMLGSILSGRK